MNVKYLGIAVSVVVGAGSFAATAQDTYTAGAAMGRLDPSTGLPSTDPNDVGVLAGGAYTLPNPPFTTPVVNAGQTFLADVPNSGLSDLYSDVGYVASGNLGTVYIEYGMGSGNVFTSLWGGGSPVLPSGNFADLLMFDVGNATGSGAPLFPIDGVDIGSEWVFSSARQRLYNAGGMFSDTAFTPLAGLPQPVATHFYFAGGFDFGTLNATDMNKVVWEIEIELVPAPGALALIGIAGLAGRRRRR